MGEQMGHENEGKWHVNESGRGSLDSLINVITENVKKNGGWPDGSNIGIPDSENGLPKLEEQRTLPKGAHVTIE